MRNLQYIKLVVVFLAVIMTLLAMTLFLNSSVDALSNWEPHEPDFNTSSEQTWSPPGTRNMRFVTDNTGTGGALRSVVSIYTRTPSVSITIRDAVLCNDGPAFGDGPNPNILAQFSIESYSPAAGTVFGSYVDRIGCAGGGSRDVTIVRDISSNSQPVVIGGITWHRSKLRAAMQSGFSAGNSFEVIVNNAGALVSYYSQSGNEFVLQDRGTYGAGSPRLTDYHLKFGTECSVTSNTTAALEWYDDDHPGINSDPRFNYRMELIERNRAGALTGVRYYLNNNGANNFIGGTSWGGSGAGSARIARFTAKPDHTYEWIWHGVSKSNAIQFELPYDSIYYQYGCPTDNWDYTPGISANKTQAYPGESITLTHSTSISGTNNGASYARAINVNSGGARVNRSTSWGADSGLQIKQNGTPGIPTGSPAHTRNGNYDVRSDATPGNVCFSAGISTTKYGNESSGQVCVEILALPIWDYYPSVRFLPDRYPGEEFDVTSDVVNNGTIAGVAFDHQIHSWEGETNLTDPPDVDLGPNPLGNDARWTGLSALAASGGATNNTGRWKVKTTATPGTDICFRSSVSPAQGTNQGGLGTLLAQRFGPDVPPTPGVCFKVKENRRFGMSSTVGKSGVGVATPGNDAVFNVFITNDSPGQNHKDQGSTVNAYPYAAHDRTQGINCSFTATNGTVQGSPTCNDVPADGDAYGGAVTVEVSNTANVGDTVCLTASGTALNGFSYGPTTDYNGGFTDTECFVVAVAPYVHAYNGDVWAGANFDTDAHSPNSVPQSCNPADPDPDPNSSAEILTSQQVSGSLNDYGAFATGSITGFKSANALVSNTLLDLLTFANDPSWGNYTSTTQCIPDYYGLMFPEGVPLSSGSVNMPASSLADGSQYSRTGNLTVNGNPAGNGAGTRYEKNMTFVVSGDIYIKSGGSDEVRYYDDYGDLGVGSFNVPSLVLIAKGNIYIEESITRIDALLIAQGEYNPVTKVVDGGTIWTCAEPSGSNLVAVTDVSSSKCDAPLTINGALIANRIEFMRTAGDNGGVHSPSSVPAEIINFSPEFYLSNPVFNTGTGEEYETVQTRDLPPVY